VNSANVTDPATGSQAINLPIDVVSSVQVISNPYDPEYGKFSGAISSVELEPATLKNFMFPCKTLFRELGTATVTLLGLGLSPRVSPLPAQS